MIPRRCGLLKKEASIVCHGASGEKLCCASKQEHCPSAAWKSDFRTRHPLEISETRPQPLPARRLHLRRETNQGPLLQHLGRSDYTRTVPDAPVLAVVAAGALAAEGFLGRSGTGAGRPGRDRPLPQPVVTFKHYMTRSATRRRSAASSPASDTLKYRTALASYAPT